LGIRQGSLHVYPFLARSSFFIFASHAILILDDISKFILLQITSSRGDLFYCCDLLFRPMMAIAFCLGLFYLLNRWLPSVARVLTGAR
jgi:hypothetical protein